MMLDPQTIVVPLRQRGKPDDSNIASLAESIKRIGQIHPIVVKEEEGEIILVAGETRLRACLKLGLEVEVKFRNELTPLEAKILELEENVKRSDLGWRQVVASSAEIHNLYSELHKDDGWTLEKTAVECLSITYGYMQRLMTVYKHLDSPALKDSNSIKQSYSILQTIANRRATTIVEGITNVGSQLFSPHTPHINPIVPESSSISITPVIQLNHRVGLNPVHISDNVVGSDSTTLVDSAPVDGVDFGVAPVPPIICADFLEWVKAYSGPKFTLIHCDFPYDIQYDSYAKTVSGTKEDYDFKGFFPLTEGLISNLDKLASYSCHIMFWFSMEYYTQTLELLESGGLFVLKKPLIWAKSDNAGIIPSGGTHPRNTYETAFLCSRGKRSLVRAAANVYSAPTPSNPIHPSQKSETVLKHFFSMLVDETTDFLDPTAGSGSSVRAAEAMGARSVLGLEISPVYAETALASTLTARAMRKAAKGA